MLRCAVIGVGAMGKNHARIYANTPDANLVAVADQDANSLKKLKYSCKVYQDYKKLLENEKIDIVSIAVPTVEHMNIAAQFIKKAIHVLIEKPITENLSEAEDLINLANKNKVKLMVGHIERFNPAVIELKNRIDKDELGKVFKMDANRVGPFPARIRDVGVVIDLAVHEIDIMRYITGAEVSTVFAMAEKQINTEHEDLLSGLMRFSNGVIGNLNINWLTPTKIRKLYVTGEKGMFIVDYLKQDLFFYENSELANDVSYADIMRGVSEGRMIKYYVKKKEPLQAEIEHFIDCVKNNKKPLVSGHDGLSALAVAKKLIASSEKGDCV